jgi:hypothetical protein
MHAAYGAMKLRLRPVAIDSLGSAYRNAPVEQMKPEVARQRLVESC